VCDRTWHDRLHVLAEGRAARLWPDETALVERELEFLPADAPNLRQAATQVFQGCPLTFRLAEELRSVPLTLEKIVVQPEGAERVPANDVAAKIWTAQMPDRVARIRDPFTRSWHYSLLALIRCEIQAIDQHWSLHRIAVSLGDGESDEILAEQIVFSQAAAHNDLLPDWPKSDPAQWREWLEAACLAEFDAELDSVRKRQQLYLRREFDRINTYFDNYERELTGRQHRTKDAAAKVAQRVAAAKAERERRLSDQVHRHEIRLIPHIDAAILIAEPAWKARLAVRSREQSQSLEAIFVPRSRRWHLCHV
jgi:hypothetical protein